MLTIRCSSLKRAMNCPGSLFFTDLPEEPSNPAAEEGTAAGEYLECLLTGKEPGTHASNGVAYTQDMKFYTSQLNREIKSRATSEVLCETRIDWPSADGVKIRGQYDACYTMGERLCIDDLKFGWGIVEVKDNWQLIGYAIGEVIRRGRAFQEIELRILQPRPHHEDGPIRSWIISYEELLKYKDAIDAHTERIASGYNVLNPGPSCKYCKAAAFCPASNKIFYRGVEMAHEFVQDSMDDTELSFQLDLIDTVSDMIKTRKQSLEMLAVDRIKSGQIVPNYVVDAKYGNRTWKDEVSAEALKLMTGKEVEEKKLISPNKLEKMGIPKAIIDSMVKRPFLGQTIKRDDAGKKADEIFGAPK